MRLVKASELQKRARDAATYSAWGLKLTLEQYCAREQRLRAHPWAREGMTSWLWCDASGRVLSSCETFRMLSVLPAGGRSPEGVTYGVASVCTEPALRGKGHASRMMHQLMETLSQTDPAGHASILFSDVGAAFYEKEGFVPRPARDWTFPAVDGDPLGPVDQLFAEDAVSEAMAHLQRPRDLFFVWPTTAQIDWHLERERIYTQLLGRGRPKFAGARAGSAVALWTATYAYEELNILVLQASSLDQVRALLQAARRIAFKASLSRVRLWESVLGLQIPEKFEDAVLNWRKWSLPMLKPFHSGVFADDWHWIPRALWI